MSQGGLFDQEPAAPTTGEMPLQCGNCSRFTPSEVLIQNSLTRGMAALGFGACQLEMVGYFRGSKTKACEHFSPKEG